MAVSKLPDKFKRLPVQPQATPIELAALALKNKLPDNPKSCDRCPPSLLLRCAERGTQEGQPDCHDTVQETNQVFSTRKHQLS